MVVEVLLVDLLLLLLLLLLLFEKIYMHARERHRFCANISLKDLYHSTATIAYDFPNTKQICYIL